MTVQIILGPPGTAKTTTLIDAVEQAEEALARIGREITQRSPSATRV